MFEPGEVVVCVDDDFRDDIRDYYNALPVKDQTYHVRDVVPGVQFDMKETTTVLLNELANLPNSRGVEPGFAPHRFRRPEEIEETITVEQSIGNEVFK